jgi:hypothetical protein
LPVQASDGDDDYALMLHYLTHSRIDGHALSGTSGAIGVNQAAGDHNQQANLRAFAIGDYASATVQPTQLRTHNRATAPDVATATIGGQAFNGASGILSINQASGTGNAEVNAVTAALAQQGIREADDNWFAAASASAGGNPSPASPATAGRERTVAVESSALNGVNGVVQLNQVAGSANATVNQLQLSVSQPPQ